MGKPHTELAEVTGPDDGLPGFIVLNYEDNEWGEPPDDDDEPIMAEHQPEQDDDADDFTIAGPDGHEWTFEQWETWVISLSIRNALEMFHGGGAMDPENPKPQGESEGFITDRQMKAMNIVIRHKVYEMIDAIAHPDVVVDEERGFTNGDITHYTLRYINKYMEPPGSPELEEAYQRIKNGQFDPVGFAPHCTRSSPDD